jgi:hypothetical protein
MQQLAHNQKMGMSGGLTSAALNQARRSQGNGLTIHPDGEDWLKKNLGIDALDFMSPSDNA